MVSRLKYGRQDRSSSGEALVHTVGQSSCTDYSYMRALLLQSCMVRITPSMSCDRAVVQYWPAILCWSQ